MKRMRDYSRWPLLRLARQARVHRRTIMRCKENGTSYRANALILSEIQGQIRAKVGQ